TMPPASSAWRRRPSRPTSPTPPEVPDRRRPAPPLPTGRRRAGVPDRPWATSPPSRWLIAHGRGHRRAGWLARAAPHVLVIRPAPLIELGGRRRRRVA